MRIRNLIFDAAGGRRAAGTVKVRAAAMGSGVTPAPGCERIVALARVPHRTAGPSGHAGPRFHARARPVVLAPVARATKRARQASPLRWSGGSEPLPTRPAPVIRQNTQG